MRKRYGPYIGFERPRLINAVLQWEEKRVFYMTPQTLMNDLKTNNCDPGDIVLLVIG